jgi:hypothetical protein
VLYSLPLNTSGSERERAEALAEHPFPQTAECGRCGSETLRDLVVIQEGGGRDGTKVLELLGKRDDAKRVVDLERERTASSCPWICTGRYQ